MPHYSLSSAAAVMGQKRTPAKAKAARLNGHKGGRPRVYKTGDKVKLKECHTCTGVIVRPGRDGIVAVNWADGAKSTIRASELLLN